MQAQFNRIDVNGDKVITKEEQMAFAEKRFDMNDENKDGMVTMKEIKMTQLKRKMERLEKQMEKQVKKDTEKQTAS